MNAVSPVELEEMRESIRKADVLIEALPYIQQFRGEFVVVKLGGSAMEDEAHVAGVLKDVAFMSAVNMRPILVHGGGKRISRRLEELNIKPVFLKGLRVTCERTMGVVQEVLNREINPLLVAMLKQFGAKAEGIRGETVFRAVRKTEVDSDTGRQLDWGYVGEPVGVNLALIRPLLRKGLVPVLTPLGSDENGQIYNMNADSAAAAIATALRARKLVFLSDVPGLQRDPADPRTLISTLRLADIDQLTKVGTINGGMLPKVESCVAALRAGVRKIHIVDARMPHSLLLEIFTDKGVGTEIVAD
ncbi:MAG: acetylglutamate kinase [Kiritimatiellae bacterium]|nr:acetylglutamate kinase [Kiritimatiellia bacterium]